MPKLRMYRVYGFTKGGAELVSFLMARSESHAVDLSGLHSATAERA